MSKVSKAALMLALDSDLRRSKNSEEVYYSSLVAEYIKELKLIKEVRQDYLSMDPKSDTFGGLYLEYNIRNVNKNSNPSRGIDLGLYASPRIRFSNIDQQVIKYRAHLTLYQEILDNHRLYLATRIGLKHLSGNIDLFQNAVLGGAEDLRGLRNNRFTGRTVVYINTDLRTRLGSLKIGGLPISYGVNIGFDRGRIWYDEETSNIWRNNFSGGLWFSPLDLAVLSFSMTQGIGENRITAGLGFFF